MGDSVKIEHSAEDVKNVRDDIKNETKKETTGDESDNKLKLETVFDNNDNTEKTSASADQQNLNETEVEKNEQQLNEKDAKESHHSIKTKTSLTNKSDIFSMNEPENDLPASLFSFRGVPTRSKAQQQRLLLIQNKQKQQNEPNNEKEEIVERPETIPATSSNQSTNSRISRNVLTGEGVVSNDEFKSPTKKNARVDGNPVLGVGYKEAQEAFHSNSNNPRIPPGGWSKGLW